MNKKSHILLSDYLSQDIASPFSRKLISFGSILPDLMVYTFIRKHSFLTRRTMLYHLINCVKKSRFSPLFFVRLGCILHYTADFFTAPHNTKKRVPLNKHLAYEEFLYHKLKSFLSENTLSNEKIDDVFKYICALHAEYKKQPFSAENDCHYIFNACSVIYFSLKK